MATSVSIFESTDGGTPPIVSAANGTNAAKQTTATVDAAGDYLFQVTIADSQGLAVTSEVDVTVDQVPASLAITTAPSTLSAGAGGQFTVTGLDQFGQPLDDTLDPTVNWTASNSNGGDGGTINSISGTSAYYVPPTDNGGVFTITASGSTGSPQASTTVSVAADPPDDFTATESSDGSGVALAWDFDNGGLDNANGFDLEREATGDHSPTVIATDIDPATTSYTDTGLTNGIAYTYSLLPYNMVGDLKVYGTPATASVTMIGMVTATPSNDPIVVSSSGTGSTQVTIRGSMGSTPDI